MPAAKSRPAPKTAAGIAGASGGTGILGFAALIPDEYHFLKQFIIYISPTASILIGVFWAWGTVKLVSWINQKQFNRGLTAARELRDHIVNDPNASAEHKRTAQANVQNLELVAFEVINNDTQSIRAAIGNIGAQNPADPE